MNKKWFRSAALAGSGHEKLADSIVREEDITSEKLNEIDILFVKDISEFFSKKGRSNFTIVTEDPVAVKDQEKFILEHPGNFFLSRVGHDIINLISPLEHFEYIENDLIIDRVHSGSRFGKQINFLGHLQQKTSVIPCEETTYPEILEYILTLCRKNNIDVKVKELSPFKATLKYRFLLIKAVEEIMLNWKEHGTGEYVLTVDGSSLTFNNKLKRPLNIKRPKAQLRCPFMQKNTGKGHGLGLYIVSITSSKGDFDWNIFTDENCFSLSLLFS